MKRSMLFLLLVFITVLALPGPSHAVQLQQGWYAWFAGVHLEGPYNPNTGAPYYTTWWYPATSLGQSGPLDISVRPYFPDSRMATVRASTDIQPRVLFEDAGTSAFDRAYYTVSAMWETDYDADKMRLQLLRRRVGLADELLWEQASSSHQIAQVGSDPMSYSYPSPLFGPGDRLVIRIVAVPEPASAMGLLVGIVGVCTRLRRRRC